MLLLCGILVESASFVVIIRVISLSEDRYHILKSVKWLIEQLEFSSTNFLIMMAFSVFYQFLWIFSFKNLKSCSPLAYKVTSAFIIVFQVAN